MRTVELYLTETVTVGDKTETVRVGKAVAFSLEAEKTNDPEGLNDCLLVLNNHAKYKMEPQLKAAVEAKRVEMEAAAKQG